MKSISLSWAALLLGAATACRPGADTPGTDDGRRLSLATEVLPFADSDGSRANLEGTGFATGDRLRIKIICPYSPSTEYGESTWGNSFDSFWLQKYTGSGWGNLEAADGCDINGDLNYSGSGSVSLLNSLFPAQQTPYVFTATTWVTEHRFVDKSGNTVLQYAPVFHADQQDEERYRASDLLWAQTVMQTGTDCVFLQFHHVMAALQVTFSGQTLGTTATLTLEGMPDIDGQEVVVGDRYAWASKSNSAYNYRQKSACDVTHHGKVLGIGVNDTAADSSYTRPLTGCPNPAATGRPVREAVPNTATYTALRTVGGQTFRCIVPPYQPATLPLLVLRDGNHRWDFRLTEPATFEQGTLYKLTLQLP